MTATRSARIIQKALQSKSMLRVTVESRLYTIDTEINTMAFCLALADAEVDCFKRLKLWPKTCDLSTKNPISFNSCALKVHQFKPRPICTARRHDQYQMQDSQIQTSLTIQPQSIFTAKVLQRSNLGRSSICTARSQQHTIIITEPRRNKKLHKKDQPTTIHLYSRNLLNVPSSTRNERET